MDSGSYKGGAKEDVGFEGVHNEQVCEVSLQMLRRNQKIKLCHTQIALCMISTQLPKVLSSTIKVETTKASSERVDRDLP